jgi:thiol:disulfide interchange protein
LKTIPLIALAAMLALTACKATAPTTTTNSPFVNHAIYPDPAQASTDLATALKTAASSHKRILLDFGGNWCADCKVLDIYFQDESNRTILEADYVLVHMNIGHMNANLDLARQYEVPLEKGVPALAVLDEHGTLLYSQKGGEFEAMRRMESAEVTKFLVQWEPEKPCSTVMVNC